MQLNSLKNTQNNGDILSENWGLPVFTGVSEILYVLLKFLFFVNIGVICL
jgi:hypothetical protein